MGVTSISEPGNVPKEESLGGLYTKENIEQLHFIKICGIISERNKKELYHGKN